MPAPAAALAPLPLPWRTAGFRACFGSHATIDHAHAPPWCRRSRARGSSAPRAPAASTWSAGEPADGTVAHAIREDGNLAARGHLGGRETSAPRRSLDPLGASGGRLAPRHRSGRAPHPDVVVVRPRPRARSCTRSGSSMGRSTRRPCFARRSLAAPQARQVSLRHYSRRRLSPTRALTAPDAAVARSVAAVVLPAQSTERARERAGRRRRRERQFAGPAVCVAAVAAGGDRLPANLDRLHVPASADRRSRNPRSRRGGNPMNDHGCPPSAPGFGMRARRGYRSARLPSGPGATATPSRAGQTPYRIRAVIAGIRLAVWPQVPLQLATPATWPHGSDLQRRVPKAASPDGGWPVV